MAFPREQYLVFLSLLWAERQWRYIDEHGKAIMVVSGKLSRKGKKGKVCKNKMDTSCNKGRDNLWEKLTCMEPPVFFEVSMVVRRGGGWGGGNFLTLLSPCQEDVWMSGRWLHSPRPISSPSHTFHSFSLKISPLQSFHPSLSHSSIRSASSWSFSWFSVLFHSFSVSASSPLWSLLLRAVQWPQVPLVTHHSSPCLFSLPLSLVLAVLLKQPKQHSDKYVEICLEVIFLHFLGHIFKYEVEHTDFAAVICYSFIDLLFLFVSYIEDYF